MIFKHLLLLFQNRLSTILLIATCLLASVQLDASVQSEENKCSIHTECGNHSACINGRCVNPCIDVCGPNAKCQVIHHVPRCECLPDFTGDPFVICKEKELECKTNNTCGNNARCKVIKGIETCVCLTGYHGDPLSGCRAHSESDNRCESNRDCGSRGCCWDSYCYPDDSCETFVPIIRVNPVKTDPKHPCDPDPCTYNEICREKNGNAFCQCRFSPYVRFPEFGCNSECTNKFNCPSDKTCFQSHCVNSCPGDCSQNDECYVFNHKAKCRPKNSRSECTSNNECSSDKACDGYKCVDPCEDHCLENADCRIVDQQPICTCIQGYYKGPYQKCYKNGVIVE